MRRLLAALVLVLAPVSAYAADADLVGQGEYIARLGDCAACHTAPGGKALAGGLDFATPIGSIYASNITPDRDTGIGAWSYDEFVRLMRRGIGRHGEGIYPAMPYPSYARLSDADLRALYAYLMHGVAPVAQRTPRSGIPWPLSMRWPLRVWAWAFAPRPDDARRATPAVAAAGADRAAQIARGAYLVEGLGHCGACHTRRRLTQQERALTAHDGAAYLAGGAVIDGWEAPNLRGDDRDGLGRWSEADIARFLRTGRNDHGAVFGGMTDVVRHSTQFMTDADLHAIAAYLKSLPAADAGAAPYRPDPAVAEALRAGHAPSRGAQLYVDRCAACHRTDGRGYPGTFPPLAGNPVLNTADPTSAIHIVLSGARLPGVPGAPSALAMGPYAKVLAARDVAELVTFIDTAWGNRGAVASADAVRALARRAVTIPGTDPNPVPPAGGPFP